MIIKYRGKNYSVNIINKCECYEIIDCEIKFKSANCKQEFLDAYYNRQNFVHGDKAKIGEAVYNKCYFYNKDDSKTIVKCHIDMREGWYGR